MNYAILVVEDSPAEADLLRRYCFDGAIIVVRDREQALAQLDRVQAVSVDFTVPGLNTVELVTTIKRLRPTMPVIALTGSGAGADQLRRAGADMALIKPITRGLWRKALESYLPLRDESPDDGVLERSTTSDITPIQGATTDDLDLIEAQRYLAEARQRAYTIETEVLPFLIDRQCVTPEGVPTLTGILCLAKSPTRWVSYATVDLLVQDANGTEQQLRQLRGRLPELIETTVVTLGAMLPQQIGFSGVRRIHQSLHPDVLRELTTNALYHRDWRRIPNPVQITVEPGRVVWDSPGGLPKGVTPENIMQTRVLRNPVLAQVLLELGIVERFGRGIDKVMRHLRQQGWPEPRIIDTGMRVSVEVQIALTPSAAPRSQGHTSRTSPTLGPEARARVILRLLDDHPGGLALRDIAGQLGIAERTVHRDLSQLIAEGRVREEGRTNGKRYYPQLPTSSSPS